VTKRSLRSCCSSKRWIAAAHRHRRNVVGPTNPTRWPRRITKWLPPGMRPWHESLYEPYLHRNSQRYLSEYGGVTIKDNDPERIRAAATQMLWRYDGDAAMTMWRICDACQSHLSRTRELRHSCARAFLGRYGDLTACLILLRANVPGNR
jgi:hypothetical protein